MASIKTQKRNRSNKLGSTVSKNRRTKKVGGVKRKRSTEKTAYLFAIEWSLEFMREVMGKSYVRNLILQHFVPGIKNLDHSETFDGFREADDPSLYKNKESQILAYCEKISTIQPYVVFTASNILYDDVDEHGNQDTQTHYQCFYVDNANKTLYVFDPARKADDSDGIYEPQIAIYTVNEFFKKKKKYKVFFARLSHPAQLFESDIFCQTWTLYLLIQFFKHDCKKGVVLPIPEKLVERYAIIIDFYHKILDAFPEVRKDLFNTYKEGLRVQENKDYILEHGGSNYTISEMKKLDPYKVMKSMNAKHLFTDEDLKMMNEVLPAEERTEPVSQVARDEEPGDKKSEVVSDTVAENAMDTDEKNGQEESKLEEVDTFENIPAKKQKPWGWPW
jgi:hypothetical protein